MSEKVLEIETKELKAVMLQTRAFMFLLYRYFKDPSMFKNCNFWEIFDVLEIETLLLKLDTVLNKMGILFGGEN